MHGKYGDIHIQVVTIRKRAIMMNDTTANIIDMKSVVIDTASAIPFPREQRYHLLASSEYIRNKNHTIDKINAAIPTQRGRTSIETKINFE